jgi:hypothetical protein
MRLRRLLSFASLFALAFATVGVAPIDAASASGTRFHAQLVGHTTLRAGAIDTEIRPEADSDTDTSRPGSHFGINKRVAEIPSTSAGGPSVAGTPVTSAPTNLGSSWEGLNHFDTRFGVDGGNQFSTEPPDQGLCAGNGYVFESVNSAVAVYSSGGGLLSRTSLNNFYGYPSALNRTTGVEGPDVFDPSCYYDAATQRWFQVASTLEVVDGALTGNSTIDIAVSKTASPIGDWNIYRIPAQNDGTDGTPDHHCAGGPCFPDYPHIGADANGFHVTINEYSFFDQPYYGVDLYSFSKAQLAAGAASVNSFLTFIDQSLNAFTIWPAQSPGTSSFATAAGGTEYLLSSDAVFNDNGRSSQIHLWALTNTSSLNSTPAPVLKHVVLDVNEYSVPAPSAQKAGDTPLRDCVNDTKLVIQGLGTGCWRFFFAPQAQPAHNEVLGPIDANDSRMQQVSYASGKVWGALDTGVSNPDRAGIAWFAVSPSLSRTGDLSGSVAAQGLLAATGSNSLAYPALAMTANGKGVMGFTLVGPDWFPSAAYVTLTQNGTSAIQVARAGNDSQDGFSEYRAFGPPFRPRWGDYGAAATDGSSIWIASEYIEASCTFSQWLNTNFRCGDTRTSLGNWSTRISKVTP